MHYKTNIWEGRRMATELEMIPPQGSSSGFQVSCCSWVWAFLLQKKNNSSKKEKTKIQFLFFQRRWAPTEEDLPREETLGPWLLQAPRGWDWPLDHVNGHLGGGAWDRPVLPAVTGISRLLIIGGRANHVHAVLHPCRQVLPLPEGPIGRRRTE